MKTLFTIENLKKSKCAHLNRHLLFFEVKKKSIVNPRNDCPEVVKMHWDLKYWCQENKVLFSKEHKFSKGRKFRFDFCLPDHKIGIEYDGLNSEKSGHTTFTGFTSDTEKRNLATSEGWRVINYTAANYMNVLNDVKKLVNNGKSK